MGTRRWEKQTPSGAPQGRSRWAALAMLSVVSAAVITCLVLHMQSFTVLDGANRYVVSTLSRDPANAVQMAGVQMGEYDAISCTGNYNELKIDRSFVVNVTVDGVTTEVHMTGGTVGDALERAGVDVSGYRLMNAQMTDAASDGLDLYLTSTIRYEERTETETVPYTVETRYTTDLAKGAVQILQKGQNGEITRVYRDTVENDTVIATVMLSESQTQPVKQIQLVGTKVGAAMSPAPYEIELDSLGQPVNYKQALVGSCTAYTNDRGLCGTITSIGMEAAVGVVAVDPKVIPYGTELYIVSADGSYVYGYAIAGDTGGAAISGRIMCDLFMNTYEECMMFGRRPMNVYILN